MESIWNEYLWLVTMSLIYIFQMWVGSSKEWGGRFRKGWAWFTAFDMGVLGPAFWVLHLTCWQVLTPVGCQHSRGRDWGPSLWSSMSRTSPGCVRLVLPTPFSWHSWCWWGSLRQVTCQQVVVFEGGWWLSNRAGCC